MTDRRARRAGLLLLVGCVAGVKAEPGFPVRTHNPFLQIYGLPFFQNADVLPHHRTAWAFTFDIANHADAVTGNGESVTLDGESYYLTLSWRRGVADWLELGVDVPFVAHSDGFLDNAIEDWHDLWGMSNAKRAGPPNVLDFSYAHPALDTVSLASGVSGLGDVRMNAAVPLRFGVLPPEAALTLKAGIKLPTGDADELTGSGATDYSLALYYSGRHAFGIDRLDISAHAGMLRTGDSDLFSPIQENTVPFGGVAIDWRFSERLLGKAAAYVQGDYVDSALEELGTSLQLIVGGEYRFAGDEYTLAFGIVEELFSDATVDFALQVSLRHGFDGGS